MLTELTAIASDLGIIAGLLSPPLYGAWRLAIRPRLYQPTMLFLSRVDGGVKTLDRIEPQVAQIMRNIGPNGGAALIDKVDRVAARLNLIIDDLPWATFEASKDGQNTRVNHQFERTFGYSAADLSGNGWKSLLHPDDALEYFAAWNAAVADVRPFIMSPSRQLRFLAKDGHVMTVAVSAFPYVTPHVTVWMGTVRVVGVDMMSKKRES